MIRFAEGHVKGDDFRAIFTEYVEHVCKMGSGKRPLSEHFLRMLIDIHDDDPRIDGRGAARAVTETGIQRVVLQALDKIENGSSAFSDESKVVQRQRKKGDDHTDDERDAVTPPC